VLALTRAFRWLIGAFHNGDLRAPKLGMRVALSIAARALCLMVCQRSRFVE
jgi:hypothetical protein